MNMLENNRVKIVFPIDFRWFPTVLSALHMYMHENEFSKRLIQMVCMATDNVLGRMYLFALDAQAGKSRRPEATFCMNYVDGCLAIDISYDRTLNFDPIGDISVESAEKNANALAVSESEIQYNEWLVEVKSQMDRVESRVEGSVRTMHMEKYSRESGKEKQMWIFSLTPCLKPDVYIDESQIEGSKYAGYLHDFRTDKVLRMGRRELDIIKRFDGKTSLFDIYIDVAANSSDGPVSPQVFKEVYEQLERNKMLVGTGDEKRGVARLLQTVRNLTLVLPQSDRLAGMFYRAFRPVFTRAGVAAVLVFALTALWPIYTMYDEFKQMFVQSFDIIRNEPWVGMVGVLLVYLTMVLHEFSHAAVVKKYGGHVPRIGITYYIFMIIFFCDTTGSGNFPKKKQRIMVSLGGPLCSLLVWAAAVWTFALSADVHVRAIAFVVYLAIGFSIVLNFNPLLRMDSYYMLSDIVGIDGLRSRSFNYIRDCVKRIFGIRVVTPNYTKWQKRWLVAYGALGTLMTLRYCLRPFIKIAQLTEQGATSSMKMVWIGLLSLVAVVNIGSLVSRNVRKITHRTYKIK